MGRRLEDLCKELAPLTCKDFLPQAAFANKNFPHQNLEELQGSILHPAHLGRARTVFSAEDMAEVCGPCPSPWASSLQSSRAESSLVGAALLETEP